MAHTKRGGQQLHAQVRRLRGQVDAVEMALAQGEECARVLQQIAAVRGAVNGLMLVVLEGHVREHLRPTGSEDTEALLQVMRRYLR